MHLSNLKKRLSFAISEAERSIQVGEEARLQIDRCGMFQGRGRVGESRVAGGGRGGRETMKTLCSKIAE